MSGVPTELRLGEASAVRRTRGDGLPQGAWLYFLAVAAATIAVTWPLVARIDSETHGWVAFAVLASSAATAQLFVVRTTRDQSYHTSSAFMIASAGAIF